MRRVLVLTAALTAITAGFGCRNHVAGRCDCVGSPADAVIVPPSNPYPTIGAPVGGPATAAPAAMPGSAPEKMPMPMGK